jgi:hypothetical protein
MAYKVSTVLWALVDVQFNGQETWTWYSQVPLVTFQYAMLGRTVGEKDVMRGWNDQAPIDELFIFLVGEASEVTQRSLKRLRKFREIWCAAASFRLFPLLALPIE